MSKSPLAGMLPFRARRWFDKEFTRLAQLISDTYATRSEITGGGGNLAAGASLSVTTLNLTSDAISSILGGLFMSDSAALVDTNVLTTAVYEDGSLHSGDPITMAGGEEVRVTLVLADSDGGGGSVGEDGVPAVVAVIAGTDPASAKLATDFPSSVDVATALAASAGVHEGTTAWVHYATVVWQGTGPAIVETLNRNNVTLGL